MKKLLLICIVIVGIVFVAGCIGGEKAIDTKTSTDTQTIQQSGASSQQYTPFGTEEPTFDESLLKSQGWIVKKTPKFYDNNNFMYEPGTVFVRDINNEAGKLFYIYIGDKTGFIGKSLTLNGVTFNNCSDKEGSIFCDIDNPNNKYISNTAGFLTLKSEKNFYIENAKKTPILQLAFPTPQRGEKIVKNTEWIPIDNSLDISLLDNDMLFLVKQMAPNGYVYLTTEVKGGKMEGFQGRRFNSPFDMIVAIKLKTSNGKIFEPEKVFSSTYGQHVLENENLLTTTEEIVSWQATIEYYPRITK